MNSQSEVPAKMSSVRPWWQRLSWRERFRAACVVVVTVLIGVGILHTWSLAETPEKEAATESSTVVTPKIHAHRVIAYYFHTTSRCASCQAIEAYSHEAIESAFADEIKDGRLIWQVVNIEVKGNEHFVKDYSLYTKSLVLVNEGRGKPATWKNLEKVWQLLHDKPKFLRYVQAEVRGYLTERP